MLRMPLDASEIRQEGLSADVVAVLRRAILSGELGGGQRIIERDLASQLGLSRGPIRDALKALELEGLVEIAPRRGARVASVTRQDIHEIVLLRVAVEPAAVQLLLERGDPSLLAPVSDALEELRRAAEAEDWAAVNAADVVLHGRLYELSGSRRLLRLWESMRAPLLQAFQHHQHVYPEPESVVRSHEALLAALRTGDVAHAQETVRAHVLDLAQEVVQRLPEQAPVEPDDQQRGDDRHG
jgi:DNA-binding GntR family transcriptional regulator